MVEPGQATGLPIAAFQQVEKEGDSCDYLGRKGLRLVLQAAKLHLGRNDCWHKTKRIYAMTAGQCRPGSGKVEDKPV